MSIKDLHKDVKKRCMTIFMRELFKLMQAYHIDEVCVNCEGDICFLSNDLVWGSIVTKGESIVVRNGMTYSLCSFERGKVWTETHRIVKDEVTMQIRTKEEESC